MEKDSKGRTPWQDGCSNHALLPTEVQIEVREFLRRNT